MKDLNLSFVLWNVDLSYFNCHHKELSGLLKLPIIPNDIQKATAEYIHIFHIFILNYFYTKSLQHKRKKVIKIKITV